jgi:hypothetical protein
VWLHGLPAPPMGLCVVGARRYVDLYHGCQLLGALPDVLRWWLSSPQAAMQYNTMVRPQAVWNGYSTRSPLKGRAILLGN